ncbi:hypothetical protein FSP39_011832 [Pinctada imbricata]|uniref:Acyltransferase n=1 Tax=Pinctada imbricata TaxID=66713 RepID=A0AA88Y920_PINIB|nr:hypothetical protein FSP39_011832 [Pinctada imbricata]
MTKVLGVEFAPLNVPFRRRLETLAVFQWTLSFLFLGFGCLFITISLLFSRFYFIPLLYLVYYVWDRKTSARGGRRFQWIRNWPLWRYFHSFFPITLVKTADLDPNKNYIMCFHPHGVLSVSAFCHFATEGSGWSKTFPGLTPYLLVLAGHFQFPFYRDYFMAGGAIEATSESMRYVLTKMGKGHALGLVVGGALEALEAFPGRYNLKLKNKKGFIKMALTTGASLVPIFSFGETELFTQVDNPEGSRLRNLQNWLTRYSGFSPPLFHGRGMFNYTFGLMPYRRPVYTVVGAPIDVELIEKPSQEQINTLHQQYLMALTELFDKHKTEYGVPESQQLHFID